MKRIATTLRTWYFIVKYQWIMKKVVFGQGVRIGCKLMIRGPGKVFIGDNCRIEPTPWGEEYVTIYTHQRYTRIEIGNGVLLRATRFGSHMKITVLNGAVLENASVFDSDFHNIDATRRNEGFNEWDREVTIGSRAYVGCESLCSKGTHLGRNTVVLPVSMLGTRKAPDNAVLGGYPAKVVRKMVE